MYHDDYVLFELWSSYISNNMIYYRDRFQIIAYA